MEWEGSSDCADELRRFNDCMVRERRRFLWTETKPPMYEYIQQRLAERRQEEKFQSLLQEVGEARQMEAEDSAAREGKRKRLTLAAVEKQAKLTT